MKLEEARHFIEQMRREETLNDHQVVRFNTSAFLTATRSVLQYLLKRCRESGQTQWYDERVSSSEWCRFFKDIRDGNIHTEPYKPSVTRNVPFYDEDGNPSPFPVSILLTRHEDGSMEFTTNLGRGVLPYDPSRDLGGYQQDWKMYSAKVGERVVPLFDSCDEYLTEIERMVREAEEMGLLQNVDDIEGDFTGGSEEEADG